MAVRRFIAGLWMLGLTGCGGGGVPEESGRAVFTVAWPVRTRLIPVATNSIKLEIIRDAELLASRVIARPAAGGTSETAFEILPAGNLTVKAAAYPNADASGVVQAKGSAPLEIIAGRTSAITVTMESTIHSLEIAPPAGPIHPGDVLQLNLIPKDEAGNLVMVSMQTVDWTSGNPGVAAVDANGVLTAGTTGSALITALERESGRGAMLTVTVEGGRLIAYEPFNYPLGQQLSGLNGGTGWAGPWGQSGAGSAAVIDTGLSFLRLQARNNSARSTSDSRAGRALSETLGAPGTTRWLSFLLRPLDSVDAGTRFGVDFGGIHLGKGAGSPNYAIENAGGGGAAASGIQAAPNATVFLAVRAAFSAGNDRIELWVNPTPGLTLPSNPDAVKQDADLGVFNEIELGANIRCQFDELRIGETYGDVGPIFQIF